jgi:hypothetical protein
MMRLVLLLLLLLLLVTTTLVAGSKKCYTRTLVNCVTNAERNNGQVIDYRVTATRDVFLDLRVGPVANRPHSWRIVWAKDRAMRCLPQPLTPGAPAETNAMEETPCYTPEYEQLPLGWAGRGVTYFRLKPCNPLECGGATNVCASNATRTDALCTENFVLYADDCDAIQIREVDAADSDVTLCPFFGMRGLSL